MPDNMTKNVYRVLTLCIVGSTLAVASTAPAEATHMTGTPTLTRPNHVAARIAEAPSVHIVAFPVEDPSTHMTLVPGQRFIAI